MRHGEPKRPGRSGPSSKKTQITPANLIKTLQAYSHARKLKGGTKAARDEIKIELQGLVVESLNLKPAAKKC